MEHNPFGKGDVSECKGYSLGGRRTTTKGDVAFLPGQGESILPRPRLGLVDESDRR